MSGREANDFCSVAKIIPKFMILWPCKTLTGFIFNLAISFQCSFLSAYVTPFRYFADPLIRELKAIFDMRTFYI